MCGRYIIREQEAAERYWRVHGIPRWTPSFNIAPTATVPIIRRARQADGGNEAVLARWGLIPYWAGGVPPKYSTFNARMERIDSAPAFRGPWSRGQRCILPASGFYEWQKRDTAKQPFFIKLVDRETFGFAGLWDRSLGADGVKVESCTIITLAANRLLTEIHNTDHRMPAILRAEDHEVWLSGPAQSAHATLQSYADELMLAYPVSTRVNSAKNDDEALTGAIQDPGPEPQAGELF